MYSLLLSFLLSGTAAPTPPTLVGRWAMRQIYFEARRPLPDSLQDKLMDSPVGDTNAALKSGEQTALVTFFPDSTYRYELSRAGQPTLQEEGSYTIRQGLLRVSTLNAQPISALDGQRIVKLTRRELRLEHPIWQPTQQVFRQTYYQRLR
ncbi:hypothetical protein [Hymenobacter profundi]|nr:hypothetical protein [Hymenobacter profundi]